MSAELALGHAAARIELAVRALRAARDELYVIGVPDVGNLVSETSDRVAKLAEGVRQITMTCER